MQRVPRASEPAGVNTAAVTAGCMINLGVNSYCDSWMHDQPGCEYCSCNSWMHDQPGCEYCSCDSWMHDQPGCEYCDSWMCMQL